jgi:L-phenylalanine/L-methionine N-acetyltransferase
VPDPAAPIVIRRALPDDAAAVTALYADPSVMPALLQMPYGNAEAMRAHLAEMNKPNTPDLQLVAEIGGVVVACAGLHPASLRIRRRHVMGLGIAVGTAWQGQGVGSALMQALCDYADGWGQVLRIELTVFTDNPRAIALYQRFGFRIEGTHRGYALRDGAYCDVHSMARLHPNPPRIEWPAA